MHRRILFGIAIVAILVGGLAYVQLQRPQPIPGTAQTPRSIEVTLEIAGVLPAHRVEIIERTTALELLHAESTKAGFLMSEKEYAGLGTLVERLGDFKNGTDGKYWTYTVNGTFAPVGADVYQPKSGDLIEWTFAVPDSSY